jgi:hypothetical protein
MAFSFTKTGFSGFSDDPKNDPNKLVDFSSSRTVEKLAPEEGYITGGQKTTYTTNKTFSNNNSYTGSDSFKFAFRNARTAGKSTFDFGGQSYSTEFKVPKTRTETSTFTSITKGIKANPINIKAPTLMTSPGTSTTNKIIPPPPPPPPQRRKRKKFKYTKVGKFIRSIGDIQLPRISFPKIRLGGGGGGRGCKSCRKKLLRTMR